MTIADDDRRLIGPNVSDPRIPLEALVHARRILTAGAAAIREQPGSVGAELAAQLVEFSAELLAAVIAARSAPADADDALRLWCDNERPE